MPLSTKANSIPELPSEAEQAIARESSRQLAAIIGRGDEANLRVFHGQDQIDIPMSAIRLLGEIVNQLARGNAFSLMPIGYQLTTQQAADLLNVSRPYLVKLLEQGEIPFQKVGRHRRILHEDLTRYVRRRSLVSDEAMQRLADQAQELGLGY